MFGNTPIQKIIQVLLGVLLSTFLAACTMNDGDKTPEGDGEKPPDAIIAPGDYERVQPDFVDITYETAPGVILAVIDREEQRVVFELEDGSQISASLDMGSSSWGQGCPTSSYVTSMEIIYLEEDELTLDGVAFERPVLVATCPSSKNMVVLREYGNGFDDILPGAACDWWAGAKCIYFGKE